MVWIILVISVAICSKTVLAQSLQVALSLPMFRRTASDILSPPFCRCYPGPLYISPVCGSDGITYGTICDLVNSISVTPGLGFRCDGSCPCKFDLTAYETLVARTFHGAFSHCLTNGSTVRSPGQLQSALIFDPTVGVRCDSECSVGLNGPWRCPSYYLDFIPHFAWPLSAQRPILTLLAKPMPLPRGTLAPNLNRAVSAVVAAVLGPTRTTTVSPLENAIETAAVVGAVLAMGTTQSSRRASTNSPLVNAVEAAAVVGAVLASGATPPTTTKSPLVDAVETAAVVGAVLASAVTTTTRSSRPVVEAAVAAAVSAVAAASTTPRSTTAARGTGTGPTTSSTRGASTSRGATTSATTRTTGTGPTTPTTSTRATTSGVTSLTRAGQTTVSTTGSSGGTSATTAVGETTPSTESSDPTTTEEGSSTEPVTGPADSTTEAEGTMGSGEPTEPTEPTEPADTEATSPEASAN